MALMEVNRNSDYFTDTQLPLPAAFLKPCTQKCFSQSLTKSLQKSSTRQNNPVNLSSITALLLKNC